MNLTKEQHEETYHHILKFYDFAEELIATVEHKETVDPIAQLEFIEPLVKQVEEATDILTQEYRQFVQTGKKPGMFTRKRIEKALAQIHQAIELCKKLKAQQAMIQ